MNNHRSDLSIVEGGEVSLVGLSLEGDKELYTLLIWDT